MSTAHQVESAEEPQWLSGREMRRLTRAATEAHGGGRLGELIGEVYSILFSGAIAWLVVIGAVQTLSTQFGPETAEAALDSSWLALAWTLIGLGLLLSLFARLGPVSASAGQGTWWLPMPADRAGLLRPKVLVMSAVGALAGIAIGAVTGTLLDASDTTAIVAGVLGLGAAGMVLPALCTIGQITMAATGSGRFQLLVRAGDTLVVLGPILSVVAVLVHPPALPLTTALFAAAAVFAVAGAAALMWIWRRLDGIGGQELRSRGAISGHAAGSVLSLDTRELGRALTVSTLARDRRRSSSWSWVRGPVGALVTGDAVLLARSPRHVLQVIVGLSAAVLPLLAGWHPGLAVAGFLIGGYLASLATGEGARRAEMAPVLDRQFPLSAPVVRRVRLLWPLIVMTAWTLVVMAGWGWMFGDSFGWLILGVVAAPTFAAGVLRAAYRPPPDWTRPLMPGPFGPVAPGVLSAFSRGPDIVVLCLVPLIVATLATGPTEVVIFIQLATTALALSIACHLPDKRNTRRVT